MIRLILIIYLLTLMACTIEPQPIAYGEEQCHACKMIISDQRFGAELVTTKGKVFKYDAIECMVPDLIAQGKDAYSYILVTAFDQSGKLILAEKAWYLTSKQRPSPMGGNLSAYASDEVGNIENEELKGDLLSWEELIKQFQ